MEQEEYYEFINLLCYGFISYKGKYDVINNINYVYDKILLNINNTAKKSEILRTTPYTYEFLTYDENIANEIKNININFIQNKYNNKYEKPVNITYTTTQSIIHCKNQHYKYTLNLLKNLYTYLFYTNYWSNKIRYFCSITVEFSMSEKISDIMFKVYPIFEETTLLSKTKD